jgi:peroxiredoxin
VRTRLEGLGARTAAISVDAAEESRTFAKDRGLGFPLLRDEGLAVAVGYGVAMEGRDIPVPATFVVAPDRRLLFAHVGETMTDLPASLEVLGVVQRWADAHRGTTP